jgi:hypothetical protein
MNPDERIKVLEAQVAELTKVVQALGSFNTIPLNIEKALKARLLSNVQPQITDITDSFTPPFFDQAVNEGGMASYSVMTTPEYALQVKIGSLAVAIPAFDI